MNYPTKNTAMTQLNGETGQAESTMKGGERIYSQEDTKKIVDMANKAKTTSQIVALGEFVYNATKSQPE